MKEPILPKLDLSALMEALAQRISRCILERLPLRPVSCVRSIGTVGTRSARKASWRDRQCITRSSQWLLTS